MIKKLQKRFILAAMLSLALVLAVIIGSGSIMSYYAIVSRADETLTTLTNNNGTFIKDSVEEYLAAKKAYLYGAGEPPPEISYYFTVLMSMDGQPLSVNVNNIMKVDDETATSYANSVWSVGRTKGFFDGYRYLRTDAQDQDGELLIFLDCEQKLLSFKNFLVTSLFTSLAGLSAVWVLLVILAKGIVRPISESYEKQKQFITDAGHELKTPLTIISADTDVLEMQQGSSEWLSDIRVQIERLFSVLLDNAVQYSQPQGQISVVLQPYRHSIRLEVFNTTELIEKEQLPRLFDRFYRTDPSRSSETGGHGIGLSIAKAVVLAHGGEITAASQDNRSLTVTVLLPTR